MDITFNCDQCGQSIVIDEAGAGSVVDCPKCRKPLEVPHKSEPLDKSPLRKKLCPDCGQMLLDSAVTCGCGWDSSRPPRRMPVSSPPPPSYRRVEGSGVAGALTAIAVLEFIASPIAGVVVGSESTSLGWLVFVCGVNSGLILLGFGRVIEHLYESAQRLRQIEMLLQKAHDDKTPAHPAQR